MWYNRSSSEQDIARCSECHTSSVFRAKREIDFVRMRSIFPFSASSTIRLNWSRFVLHVPEIPSSEYPSYPALFYGRNTDQFRQVCRFSGTKKASFAMNDAILSYTRNKKPTRIIRIRIMCYNGTARHGHQKAGRYAVLFHRPKQEQDHKPDDLK